MLPLTILRLHRLTSFSAARGNTSLESAVSLTKSLRWDIQALGQTLAKAANEGEEARRNVRRGNSKASCDLEIKEVVKEIRRVLDRIEDAVPLINLAITTSGANLSTSLPSTISPSRLLQASTFLTAGDSQYATLRSPSVQIGPAFTLSLYMLFQGHLRPQSEEDIRATTWQEVVHKAHLKLLRVPLDNLYDPADSSAETTTNRNTRGDLIQDIPAELRSDEYAYRMVLIEDLDDDRVHTFDEADSQPSRCLDVEQAGIREIIPVHEISKIFYADTGKILNIGSDGEINNPILLLKRDHQAVPPRRMMQRFNEFDDQVVESVEQPSSPPMKSGRTEQDLLQPQVDPQLNSGHCKPSADADVAAGDRPWRIPSNIDPEWLAFEVYTESEDSDAGSESAEVPTSTNNARAASSEPSLTTALSNLELNGSLSPSPHPAQSHELVSTSSREAVPVVRTSLSLLETLLRLLSLQQFQQASHLTIPDELLNFFLSEAATTGAATGDDVTRRRMRYEARQHVGFDPYDESPIKRRGEDYQYRGGTSQAGNGGWNESSNGQWGNEQYNGDYGWTPEQAEYANTSPQDEGYGTYQFSDDLRYQQPQQARERASPSPRQQLLLSNRRHSSRTSTPDRTLPPFPRSSSNDDNARRLNLSSSSPRTPPSMQARFRSFQQAGARRGSPLAKPERKDTEEKLQESPVESREGKKD